MARHACQQPDWIALAKQWNLHLTADSPLWIGASQNAGPTQLEVQIHKGFEVGIAVTRGYELRHADFTQTSEPGAVFLTAMWEPHAWRHVKSGTLVVFCFLPEVLETELCPELSLFSMFAVPARQRPRVSTPELRTLSLSVAQDVMREYVEQPLGYLESCRLHLLRLLIGLRREWEPPLLRQTQTAASDIRRIQSAIALASSMPPRRARPIEAAAACNLSVSRFHQIFSRTMGLSYGDFCRRVRLALAARLLLDTDLSIGALAKQAGFNDGNHLYYRFVEHYGMTPSEYRREGQVLSGPSARSRS